MRSCARRNTCCHKLDKKVSVLRGSDIYLCPVMFTLDLSLLCLSWQLFLVPQLEIAVIPAAIFNSLITGNNHGAQ